MIVANGLNLCCVDVIASWVCYVLNYESNSVIVASVFCFSLFFVAIEKSGRYCFNLQLQVPHCHLILLQRTSILFSIKTHIEVGKY